MFPTGTPPATYGEELAVAQFLNAVFCNLQEVDYFNRAEKGSKEDLAWEAICSLFLTVRQQAREPVAALPEVAVLTDPHESDSDDGPYDEDEEQVDQLDGEELFEAVEPVECGLACRRNHDRWKRGRFDLHRRLQPTIDCPSTIP
ncbi:hypothetical protein FA13DRAFT_1740336, partial [Coprinellus micaceus]